MGSGLELMNQVNLDERRCSIINSLPWGTWTEILRKIPKKMAIFLRDLACYLWVLTLGKCLSGTYGSFWYCHKVHNMRDCSVLSEKG